MPDQSFERKFGQLADAELNQRIPALVDYRIGFQIIDKNEEETRAVGIAAFIINGLWVYVPVFFINGRLRGFDLLYLQQRDLFVPARDNWVNMLKEQGTTVIGKLLPRWREQKDRAYAPQEVTVYSGPSANGYGYKTAALSDNPSKFFIDATTMQRMLDLRDHEFDLDLTRHLPSISKEAAVAFANTLVSSTDFANAALTFYTPDDIEKLAAELANKCAETPQKEAGDLAFITDLTSKEAADLSVYEKKQLVNNGLYIRDTRTNHSKVFHHEVDTGILQNPTYPGIYDVLLQDGTFKRMIVLFPYNVSQAPTLHRQYESNVNRKVALLDPEKSGKYVCAQARDIFVRPATDVTEAYVHGIVGGTEATAAAIRGLPEEKRDGYVIGRSTILLVDSPDRSFEARLCQERSDVAGNVSVVLVGGAGHGIYGTGSDELVLEFTDKPGKLFLHGSKLFVPQAARLFHQAPDDEPMLFGDLGTINNLLYKSAGLVPVRVFAAGKTASLQCNGSSTGTCDRADVLKQLVAVHGIYAGQAQQLLKDAERDPFHARTFLIKHAAPYDIAAYGDSAIPFQGGPSAMQTTPITTIQTMGGREHGLPESSDGSPIFPQHIIERAMAAADAGIKEVFDVSVLSGLVEVADLSGLRNEYLVDMIKGMDKIARMLFLYYWHFDEFKDRYGEEDMRKLEDTLRKVFVSLGDLILFLKEKTAYNPDISESLFGTLSEDIGSKAVPVSS